MKNMRIKAGLAVLAAGVGGCVYLRGKRLSWMLRMCIRDECLLVVASVCVRCVRACRICACRQMRSYGYVLLTAFSLRALSKFHFTIV